MRAGLLGGGDRGGERQRENRSRRDYRMVEVVEERGAQGHVGLQVVEEDRCHGVGVEERLGEVTHGILELEGCRRWRRGGWCRWIRAGRPNPRKGSAG